MLTPTVVSRRWKTTRGEELLTAASVQRPIPTICEATILTWTQQPLTREVARGLRAATRKSPGLDGHRFSYNDLKELWKAEEGGHLVLTHDADPVWQHWATTPDGGWQLTGYYADREAAKAAAEAAPISAATPQGRYVLAWRPGGRTIRVRCQTHDPVPLQGIFQRLGYETNVEDVA